MKYLISILLLCLTLVFCVGCQNVEDKSTPPDEEYDSTVDTENSDNSAAEIEFNFNSVYMYQLSRMGYYAFFERINYEKLEEVFIDKYLIEWNYKKDNSEYTYSDLSYPEDSMPVNGYYPDPSKYTLDFIFCGELKSLLETCGIISKDMKVAIIRDTSIPRSLPEIVWVSSDGANFFFAKNEEDKFVMYNESEYSRMILPYEISLTVNDATGGVAQKHYDTVFIPYVYVVEMLGANITEYTEEQLVFTLEEDNFVLPLKGFFVLQKNGEENSMVFKPMTIQENGDVFVDEITSREFLQMMGAELIVEADKVNVKY